MSKHISKFTGAEIDAKLSKVNQEFTNVEKNKLAALKNYDDSEINTAIKNNKTNIEANAAAIEKNTSDIATNTTAIEAVKSSISNLQTTKANSSDVYTKTETDNKITSINNAIAANTDAIEDKLDKSALQYGLIPEEYTTITSYVSTLPLGRHQLFYRNASDAHITDAPMNANTVFDVLKPTNTAIRINAFPIKQVSDTFYSCSFSGGGWGQWFKYATVTEEPTTINE